jgi:hypothetical protein
MNYSFNQFTNSTLRKGCFHKNRYDSAEEASKELIHGFNSRREFLRHYKCPNCHGYHLTKKKANQNHLQRAKDFLKWGRPTNN